MEGAEKFLGVILFLTSKAVSAVDAKSFCFLVYFEKGLENWVNFSPVFSGFLQSFVKFFVERITSSRFPSNCFSGGTVDGF